MFRRIGGVFNRGVQGWYRFATSRTSNAATLAVWLGSFVALCCVGSVLVGMVQGAGRAVGVVPTVTPTSRLAVTMVPTATLTPSPTNAPAPTRTPHATTTSVPTTTNEPRATVAPTIATPAQSAVPTSMPVVAEPTPAPAAVGTPVFTKRGQQERVSPAWWPCTEGQIKANNNSNIYHVPSGASYDKTFKNVTCFATADAAAAAGFVAAKR